MRTPAILGLTLALLALGAGAHAQPIAPDRLPGAVRPAAIFTSDESFLEWITHYYIAPNPRDVPRAFVYFIDSDLMQNEARRMPIAAFFGATMRKTPEIAQAIRVQVDARSDYDTLFAYANALWFANADWAREELRSLADAEQNEQVSNFLVRRSQSASPTGEARELRSLIQLESMWGEFGATGDPRLVERISEVMLTEFEMSPDALILQQACEQSLRLHARKHPPARTGIQNAIDRAPESPRRDALAKLLQDVTP